MNDHQLAQLQQLTDNLVFYSESEAPVKIIDLPVASPEAIIPFIAGYVPCKPENIRVVNERSFFDMFRRRLNGPDAPMAENARRFLALQTSLRKNFEVVQVVRVKREGQTSLPLFIVFGSRKAGFAAFETVAEET